MNVIPPPTGHGTKCRILLAAVNSKYIQTNPAVRFLKYYAQEQCSRHSVESSDIVSGEWNINMDDRRILRDIISFQPHTVLFSVYIWNKTTVFRIAAALRALRPDMLIGMGGPEVSFAPARVFAECPAADIIMKGEGEATFAELVECWTAAPSFSRRAFKDVARNIKGVYTAADNGGYTFGGERPLIGDLGTLPFIYKPEYLDFDPSVMIVYYETSRGCPFSCAYCLSSRDERVRFYPLEKVLPELTYFMDNEFPLVKFTDRTFNISPPHYLAIWEHIAAYYADPAHAVRKKTRFHFEIAAETLSDDAIAALCRMPPETVQLEIGIQSAYRPALKAVGRSADIARLSDRISALPPSVHRHVDLIAGLPFEPLEEFAHSFDYAFAFHADMLQLGFLKILPGTRMEEIAAGYPDYIYQRDPPYEVLATPWLSFDELSLLKDIEYIADNYYNSGLLRRTFDALAVSGGSFALFRRAVLHLSRYYHDSPVQQPRRPAAVFDWCADFCRAEQCHDAAEWLKYDYFLQGKESVIPPWMTRRYDKERHFATAAQWFKNAASSSPGAPYEVSSRVIYGKTEYECLCFSDGTVRPYLFVYTGSKPQTVLLSPDNAI